MRKGTLSGWSKVFRFTLSRTVTGKGWRFMTLIPTLLLLVCIPLVFLLTHKEDEEEWLETGLREVFVADPAPADLDYRLLNTLGDPQYASLDYVPCRDAAEALERAAGEPDSLVLSLRREEDAFLLRAVLPEPSALDKKEAEHYAGFLNEYFGTLLPLKSGLTTEQLAEIMQPV